MTFTRAELEHFAAKERDRFEDLLKDFVEVASVSADPAHKRDIERCAELGAATLRAFGGRAELYRVPGGSPVVLGSFDSGPAPSDDHRLQPPRRAAGLEGDRALAERSLHVHAGR